MKALVYTGPETVEVRDVAEPSPRKGAVKVRMVYCGICGSDIGIFSGKHPRAKAPLVLGHEFVGVVEELGEGVTSLRPGDRVVAYPLLSCGECLPCRTGSEHVCRSLGLLGIDRDGGLAETAWVDADVLYKVPENLSDKAAAMIEPLAVVVRSLHQARFAPLQSAAILGAGPIGILTAVVLERSNASRVIISDIDNSRLAMCRELGFETVDERERNFAEYVEAGTAGDGVDAVFECTGVESAALESTRIARIGGCICMTGVHKMPHKVDLQALNFREQWMVGTRVYTKYEFERSVSFAPDIAPALEKIVSHVIPLSRADQVFAMIADPAVPTAKVVVDCRC